MSWSEYRKTAHVEAIQLPHPDDDLPEEIMELIGDFRLDHVPGAINAGRWLVETDEGDLEARPGDYLCRDPESGAIWPVEGETFERTYEEVAR